MLSPRGIAQAGAAGRRLAATDVAAVVVSPLQRAVQTAAIALPERTAAVDPRWAELDFGLLTGLTWDEVERRFPEAASAWRRDGVPSPPQGEAVADLRRRVAAAILDLAAGHGRGDVVVVTHGGPVRAAVGLARGLGIDGLWRVRAPHGGIRVVRLGSVLAGVREAAGAAGAVP